MKIRSTMSSSPKMVGKAAPASVQDWLADMLLQAEIARRQGLTGPLSIDQTEVEFLAALKELADAANQLWTFHGKDFALVAGNRVDRMEAALARYRGEDEAR